MSFWGWAGAIAAGWFTASALFAIAWNTVGKHILRKPPQPPASTVRHIDIHQSIDDDTTNAVITELNRRDRQRGGGL